MAKKYENYVGSGTTLYIVGGWDPDYYWQAQAFTLGNVSTNESFKVTNIKIKAYRAGTPGKLTVSIRETDGQGVPTGNDLCVGYADADSLPTVGNSEWRFVSFEEPVILNPSQQYALVFRVENLENAVYLFGTSSGTYSGGDEHFSSDSGGNWEQNSSDEDIYFEVWGWKYQRGENNYTGDDNGAYGAYNPFTFLAQTFTVGEVGPNGFTTDKISLKLYRNSPSGQPGTVTASIQALDGNGNPDGTDITSGTTDGDSLPFEDGEWRDFTLTPTHLFPNTSYALVLKCAGLSIINEVNWRWSTVTLYSGGIIKRTSNGGSSWSDVTNADFLFDIWGGGEKLYERLNSIVQQNDELYHHTRWKAQTFTVGNTGDNEDFIPNRIRLYAKTWYDDAQNEKDHVLSIKAVDGNEEPTGSDLTMIQYYGEFMDDGVYKWVNLYMPEYTLSASTQYALVNRYLNTGTTSGYSAVCTTHDTGSNRYTGGTCFDSQNTGSTWTDLANKDYYFEIWGEPDPVFYYSGSTNLSFTPSSSGIFIETYSGTNNITLTPSHTSSLIYVYEGETSMSLSLSYSSLLGVDYVGNVSIIILPVGEYSLEGVTNYLYDGNINFTLLPSYSSILEKEYSGLTTITLLPNGEYSLVGVDFIYNGQLNLTLLPSYSSLFDRDYDGQMNITILPVGEYSLISGDFIYDGNINMIILPSYQSILDGIYSGQINLIITPSAIYSLSGTGEHIYSGNIPVELLPSYSSILEGIYNGLTQITILPNSEYSLATNIRTYNGLVNFILTLSSIREAPLSAKRYGRLEPKPYQNISIVRAMNEIRRGFRNRVVD